MRANPDIARPAAHMLGYAKRLDLQVDHKSAVVPDLSRDGGFDGADPDGGATPVDAAFRWPG